MADAKIMTFGELFSPTTDVIPDNKAAAVEIEGLDGKDYIKIDTTDGSEAVKLVSSGMDGGVVLGTAALLKLSPDEGAPMKALQISTPSTGGEPYNVAMVRFTQEDKGEGQNDGGWIGLTHQNVLQIGGDCNVYINSPNRNTGILVANAGTSIYEHAELRSSLSVANTSTPGTKSVAIGEDATCAGDYSFTSGYGTSCAGDYSLAIGSHSNIGLDTLSHATAIGYATQSNADYNTSIGFEVKGHNKYGVALGGANWVATKGAIQTEFIRGLVETTDDSDTELKDAGKGTGFKVLTSNTGLNKDFVMDIRIVLNSICTADGDTFVVGDFVSREYNFTGRYLYDASSPTFVLYSGNGTTYTSGTANSLRTGIRSNSSASDKLGHDTEGVVDSFVMDAAGGCGRLTLKVHPQDPNATVFHSAKIWTESTVAIAS
jgi:hypothetical protein